jgi:hypothetical protein
VDWWILLTVLSIVRSSPPCLNVEKVSDCHANGFCSIGVILRVYQFVQRLYVGLGKM